MFSCVVGAGMNKPPANSSRARLKRGRPYTSPLLEMLQRRDATLAGLSPKFGRFETGDAPPAETHAARNLTQLAEALKVTPQEINHLNRRVGAEPSVALAKKIERQLVSWYLEDSLEELQALRRAAGAPGFDRNDPHDREVMEEVERRHASSIPKAAPSIRLDEPKAKYVRRPEHDELRDKILNARPDEQKTYGVITAVKGMGGGGKTTLAEAVVEELVSKYKRRFDGSIRLVFSKKHDPAARISDAIRQLEGTILGPAVSNIEEGMRLLIAAAHTSKKRPVVFFDDVWEARDVAPYLEAFHHCPVVITTRFAEVVADIGETITLDKYTPDQALEQLSDGLPSGEEDSLRSLARALRYWPIALSLANAFIRRKLKKTAPPFTLAEAIGLAATALAEYGITAFDRGDDNPARSTNASIQIVLSLLDPAAALAFGKLAVFPEDARVPRDLLTRWLAAADWSENRVRDFCGELRDLSLTQGYEGLTNPFIQIHDHIWMFLRGKHKDKLGSWQREFLDAVRPAAIADDPELPWPSSRWARLLPEGDAYLWQNLEHHLTEADLQHEWREAVCDWHFIAGRAAAQGTDLSDITGWDVDLFARAREAPDPDAFIRATLEDDDVLGAAHCAGLPGIRHRISSQTRDMLRELLLRDAQSDPGLAWRDHAIRRLFEIGHPQFPVTPGRDGVRYVEPRCLRVHGGDYPLGDGNPPYTESFRSQEMPLHRWPIPAFDLGIYPITNAEFAWFVRAGGYDDERWWAGEKAQAWRTGHGTNEYLRKAASIAADRVAALSDEDLARSGIDAETIQALRASSIDELRKLLSQSEDTRYELPGAFTDLRFGHPSQPVCMVSFYEAIAYCRWLSHVSGRQYTLPSEDEWEAAATSSEGHHYPFPGPFSKDKCNTREGDVWRTTPVGAFPNGATPEDTTEGGTTPAGIHDLAGNVWEWTSSGFDINPYGQYEYLPARDVRPEGSNDVSRDWSCHVVRGGSWYGDRIGARAAFRSGDDPSGRDYDLGFRVVLRP